MDLTAIMINHYIEHKLFKELKPHIVRRFFDFHDQNPHVYNLVKKYALEAKTASRSRFGIAMIWERMRWYVTIETNDRFFKLNNNHKACYARMLMIDDEFFMNMFQRRATIKHDRFSTRS